MEKPIIMQLRSVTKKYGKQKILHNINLDIPQGEIFGIVGASGSGKSTLLKIITGNLLPDSGDIVFEPKNLTKKANGKYLQSINNDVKSLKRTIGYSAQSPSFFDKLTCEENLKFFGQLYKIPKDIRTINTKILLRLVGLEDSKKKLASNLSGGMQKRLDLACALIHDPKILVLDEPTSDLDFLLRNQMWDLIKRIKEKGTTIIMSSHFLDEIEGLCDRIIILNGTRIKFEGNPLELKQKKEADLFLKIQTREREYLTLKEALEIKLHHGRIDIRDASLEVHIANPRNHTLEIQKILATIIEQRQTITDLQYTRAGISEIFKELHKPKTEAILPMPRKISRSWFAKKSTTALKIDTYKGDPE